jgi:hypothetical protein
LAEATTVLPTTKGFGFVVSGLETVIKWLEEVMKRGAVIDVWVGI